MSILQTELFDLPIITITLVLHKTYTVVADKKTCYFYFAHWC